MNVYAIGFDSIPTRLKDVVEHVRLLSGEFFDFPDLVLYLYTERTDHFQLMRLLQPGDVEALKPDHIYEMAEMLSRRFGRMFLLAVDEPRNIEQFLVFEEGLLAEDYSDEAWEAEELEDEEEEESWSPAFPDAVTEEEEVNTFAEEGEDSAGEWSEVEAADPAEEIYLNVEPQELEALLEEAEELEEVDPIVAGLSEYFPELAANYTDVLGEMASGRYLVLRENGVTLREPESISRSHLARRFRRARS